MAFPTLCTKTAQQWHRLPLASSIASTIANLTGSYDPNAQEPQRRPSCIEVFRIADLLMQREVRRLQGAAKGNPSLQRGSVASFASSSQASGPRPTADSSAKVGSGAALPSLNSGTQTAASSGMP